MPLMVSFSVVSLVLTLALGVVVGVRIQRSVTQRSMAVMRKTIQSAISLTTNTIVSGLSFGDDGIPLTVRQQHAQADVISLGSRVLVANTDIVAVDAVLADGTVIGGANAPPVGSRVARDVDFPAAARRLRRVDGRQSDSRADPGLNLPNFSAVAGFGQPNPRLGNRLSFRLRPPFVPAAVGNPVVAVRRRSA